LNPEARSLLAETEQRGQVRASGNAARELECRLLVHACGVHTERGNHAKVLETWIRSVAACARSLPEPAIAQRRLEDLVSALNHRFGGSSRLPWQR